MNPRFPRNNLGKHPKSARIPPLLKAMATPRLRPPAPQALPVLGMAAALVLCFALLPFNSATAEEFMDKDDIDGNVEVHLFDYCQTKWSNDTIDEANKGVNKGHDLKFVSSKAPADAPTLEAYNCDSVGYQGIVKRKLSNGYPVLNVGESKQSLSYLFNPTVTDATKSYKKSHAVKKASSLFAKSPKGTLQFDSDKYFARYNSQTQAFSLGTSGRGQFFPFDAPGGDCNSNAMNHYFGMSLTMQFAQPPGGKQDGKAVKFSFSGDDDVWVFIDDVLVGDLGGIHGEMGVTINFATGAVTYSHTPTHKASYFSNNLKQLFSGAGAATTNFTGNTFSDYSQHTIKLFYLERGWYGSNCKISLSSPLLNYKITASKTGNGTISNAGTSTVKYGATKKYTIAPSAGHHLSSLTVDGKSAGTTATHTFQKITANHTIKAAFAPNTYTVAYDGNGATGGSTSATSHTYDVAKKLATSGFSRTGHLFNGWNTKADGSGTAHSNAASVKNLTTKNGATVTLYAQWKECSYKVAYAANGGTGTPPATATKRYGETFATAAAGTFVRTGHGFVGWNTKADGTGAAFNAAAQVSKLSATENATVTLYAQWRPHGYNVAYAKNDVTGATKASGATALTSHTYNALSPLAICGFMRTGYDFIGWNTKADGTGAAFDPGQAVSALTPVDNDTVTLYAQWRPHGYALDFIAADTKTDPAIGATPAIAAIWDEEATLPANGFSRPGFSFTDWNVKGTSLAAGTSVRNVSAIDQDHVTISAQWREHEYDLKYDLNGATPATVAPQHLSYTQSFTVADPGESRLQGFTFTEWNTAPDGTGIACAPGQTAARLTPEDKGAVTLYAQWQENSYTLAYHMNDAPGDQPASCRVFCTQPATIAHATLAAGFVFEGWNDRADGTGRSFAPGQTVKGLTFANDAVIDLYAQWRPALYTVNLLGNQGADANGMPLVRWQRSCGDDAPVPPVPFVRPGYAFIGWGDNPDGPATLEDQAKTGDMTQQDGDQIDLYAQWRPVAYRVRFNGTQGKGSMEPLELTFDKAASLPANTFKQEGWKFAGWALEQDGPLAFKDKDEVLNLAEAEGAVVDLYAVWGDEQKVRITYAPRNNAQATVSRDHEDLGIQTGRPEGSDAQPAPGHLFVQWVDPAGRATSTEPHQNPQRSSKGFWEAASYFAQAAPISYTVVFDRGTGSGSMEPQSLTYGEPEHLNECTLHKEGFAFAGWIDTDGRTYQDGECVCNLADQQDDVVVLAAQWRPITYPIIFDGNGGDGWTNGITATFDQKIALPNCGFTRKDHQFAGWGLAPQGPPDFAAGDKVVNLAHRQNEAVILYAIWEPATNANVPIAENAPANGDREKESPPPTSSKKTAPPSHDASPMLPTASEAPTAPTPQPSTDDEAPAIPGEQSAEPDPDRESLWSKAGNPQNLLAVMGIAFPMAFAIGLAGKKRFWGKRGRHA